MSLRFWHSAGKKVDVPGFYIHISTYEIYLGTGIWHPQPPALQKIRKAIATKKPNEWTKAWENKPFRKHYKPAGESLKRPPKGFDADHPFIEDLKRKDFAAFCSIKKTDFLKPNFLTNAVKLWDLSSPLMKFLCDALGKKY